jgi:hypothetical protein
MKSVFKATFVSIVLGWTVTPALSQQANFVTPQKAECIPGEFLVKYKSGATSAAISAASQKVGGEVLDSFDFIGVKLVKTSPDKNSAETVSALQARIECCTHAATV